MKLFAFNLGEKDEKQATRAMCENGIAGATEVIIGSFLTWAFKEREFLPMYHNGKLSVYMSADPLSGPRWENKVSLEEIVFDDYSENSEERIKDLKGIIKTMENLKARAEQEIRKLSK